MYYIIDYIRNILGCCICIINNLYINIFLILKYNNFIFNHKIFDSLKNNDKLEEYTEGKIVDYNIHYGFNMYGSYKILDLLSFLKEEKAQIYVLQEFVNKKLPDGKDILYYFKEYLNIKYHFKYTITEILGIEYCNIILSKKPIKENKILYFKPKKFRLKNNGLSVKVNIFDDEVWISNIHFNSDITGYQQVYQSEELENYIFNINESHIFLGDFNSPNPYKSTKYLKKKFRCIDGNYNTYPSIYPMVKLDYCYTYKYNKNINLGIRKIKYSDHYPLILQISN